jgi:hypothetical protein
MKCRYFLIIWNKILRSLLDDAAVLLCGTNDSRSIQTKEHPPENVSIGFSPFDEQLNPNSKVVILSLASRLTSSSRAKLLAPLSTKRSWLTYRRFWSLAPGRRYPVALAAIPTPIDDVVESLSMIQPWSVPSRQVYCDTSPRRQHTLAPLQLHTFTAQVMADTRPHFPSPSSDEALHAEPPSRH